MRDVGNYLVARRMTLVNTLTKKLLRTFVILTHCECLFQEIIEKR